MGWCVIFIIVDILKMAVHQKNRQNICLKGMQFEQSISLSCKRERVTRHCNAISRDRIWVVTNDKAENTYKGQECLRTWSGQPAPNLPIHFSFSQRRIFEAISFKNHVIYHWKVGPQTKPVSTPASNPLVTISSQYFKAFCKSSLRILL